jgi:hypothetical protein
MEVRKFAGLDRRHAIPEPHPIVRTFASIGENLEGLALLARKLPEFSDQGFAIHRRGPILVNITQKCADVQDWGDACELTMSHSALPLLYDWR